MDRKEIEKLRNLSQEEISREIKKECKGKKGQELRTCSIRVLKKLKMPFMRATE